MLLNQTMMLGAADVHDRYRDMRLDVDDMTYEVKPEHKKTLYMLIVLTLSSNLQELLSLEERIGDVCTGLNEETISNRLKQRKYNCGSKSTQEVEPCCVCQVIFGVTFTFAKWYECVYIDLGANTAGGIQGRRRNGGA